MGNLLVDGSFENNIGTTSGSGSSNSEWFSLNDADPEFMQDTPTGERAEYEFIDASDGTGYTVLSQIFDALNSGISQDLSPQNYLQAGETYNFSFDALALYDDIIEPGFDVDNSPSPNVLTVNIYGNASMGQTVSGIKGVPPGAVLLGSVDIAYNPNGELLSYSVSITPTFEVRNFSVYVTAANEGSSPDTGGNHRLALDNLSLTCFISGSFIKGADQGSKSIDSLSVGDLVLTSSSDLRPIRWIGSRKFDAIDLAVNPKLRPVRIKAGALGENMPEEDLWVSRQHRVLVRSAIVQRMFGTDEVLIPAIKLTEFDGIDVDEEMQEVEYYHLLFDEHEVICSNGAWTESLFTGPEALKAVSPEARKEIEMIFPVICDPDFEPTPARHIPQKGKLMKELIARHKKNQKPIYLA